MKVSFVSLGCDKNLCDSEHMLYLLEKEGFSFAEEPKDADIVVINTCCFISDALEESIQTTIDYGKLKSEGQLKALILTGCMGQRFSEEIKKELPEVDAIVGTGSYDKIVSVIREVMVGKSVSLTEDIQNLPPMEGRKLSSFSASASLKIAEGCDKHCTYCVIPSVRGNYRSYPMEDILKEAQSLAENGICELNLVAQEVTVYGIDLYGQKMIVPLLQQLSEIEGIRWIRLLYCYPEEITDELILEMKTNPKICHYIDMPIQHCSDRILGQMGRKTKKDAILTVIAKLRQSIPDIAIRTTLICGFPGETEADHKELLDFVDEVSFDRLGAFTYSREENTVAYDMPDQIDESVKEKRRNEIMQLQQTRVFEKNRSFIGKILPCIIEGRLDDDVYVARSYRDAPDVDGFVFVETKKTLLSGDLLSVKIKGEKEYDLIGECEDESAE